MRRAQVLSPSSLTGLAFLVAGLLLVVAGARPEPARMSVQASGVANSDRPGINAHNSPAVAVDPTRPAVVALADRIDSPRFSCTLSLSTTSGLTWKAVPFTLAPDAPNCFWPDVAFDGDGRLLLLYTATGGRYNQPLGVWLQRFDGEQVAGPPVKVTGAEAFHAHLAVAGARVVVAWIQTPPANADRPLGFEPGPNPLMVARSDNGGAAFGAPVRVSAAERVAHPSVVITPGGGVIVGALDYNDDVDDYEGRHDGRLGPPPDATWRVLHWRSTDGGATFGAPPVVVADRIPAPQRIVIDLAPGPSFAADPSPARHRLYAAWDGGVGDARDVFVAASADDGATWAAPVQVGPRLHSQFLPAVGVAPDGRVDVVFYDRSGDPADVLARPAVASSQDGGRTFITGYASEDRFDTRIGNGAPQGVPQLGNQLAVLSNDEGFLGFWADTSRGTIDSAVQDLAFALVKPHPRGGRSWPLLGLGAGLVVAAAAVSLRRGR